MQIITIVRAPYRALPRPRLLIAKASTVWLWPGIPLTERRGSTVHAIPPDAIRFWLSKFMGPEIVGQPVPSLVASAAEHLSLDDEASAQRRLDSAPETFSSEGAMLAQAVAARLGIDVPAMPIAKRMPLWDRNFVSDLAPTFDRFAEAADWLDKAGTFDPSKHDRWDARSQSGKPGAFKPMDKPQSSVSTAPRPDPNTSSIDHNSGRPLFDDVPANPQGLTDPSGLDRALMSYPRSRSGQSHADGGIQQSGDHETCMNLKNSVLRTCSSLKGRKLFSCFQAAQDTYDACME